jgi:hypothetical protein
LINIRTLLEERFQRFGNKDHRDHKVKRLEMPLHSHSHPLRRRFLIEVMGNIGDIERVIGDGLLRRVRVIMGGL